MWNMRRYLVKQVDQRELYGRLKRETNGIPEVAGDDDGMEFEEVKPRNRYPRQPLLED